MPLPSSDDRPIEDRSISRGEVYDLLNDETPVEQSKETIDIEPTEDESTDKDTTPPKRESKPEGDETEEIKLEEEKEDTESEEEKVEKYSKESDDLDIIAPVRRQEILKKYPQLFKDFPQLEKSYYRDQAYNELFSTPEEAREVVQNYKAYENFSNKVFNGSTGEILATVKQNNPQAFGKIVDNYLTVLREVDDKAFYHVITNTVKSTAAAMVQEAERINNEDLLNAARTMYQYVMGTAQYTPPTNYMKQNPQQEEAQSEIQAERMQYFTERFETAQGDLQSRVDGVLKNTIDQNIDPRNSMTPYVKRVAVNEVMENVQKSIDNDPQFRRLLDRLWEKAAEQRFSKVSLEKIRSAYLSKAKTLLPENIKKSRNEALRGLGKRVREESEETEETTSTTSNRATTAPKTRSSSNRNENPSKGKSTYEFLNEG